MEKKTLLKEIDLLRIKRGLVGFLAILFLFMYLSLFVYPLISSEKLEREVNCYDRNNHLIQGTTCIENYIETSLLSKVTTTISLILWFAFSCWWVFLNDSYQTLIYQLKLKQRLL